MSQQQVATRFPAVGTRSPISEYAQFELYEDTYPAPSGPCERQREALPTLADGKSVWGFVTLPEAECNAAWREQIDARIDAQVGDSTVAPTLLDPTIERAIVRQQAAASEKRRELEATAGADLPEFDPTLDVSQPQDDVGFARLTLSIARVTPRAGFPDNIYGYVAELVIQKDYASDGADARLMIRSAPKGPRPNQPFTVDPEDSTRWTYEIEEGYRWTDPDDPVPVTADLIWGSGSVSIGRLMTVQGLHNDDSQNVRYGLPEGSVRRGRR